MSATFVVQTGVLVGKNGSHPFVVAITDSGNSDAAVTPDSASWSLYDADGEIVNSREDVALTPGESMTIPVSGDDHATAGDRKILVKMVADLAEQANAPLRFMLLYKVGETPE